MPDRDVKTIPPTKPFEGRLALRLRSGRARPDLIYYQYAKIVARRAFGAAYGKEAKKYNYGFVKETFRDLKSGVKSWSEITREDWQFVEAEK